MPATQQAPDTKISPVDNLGGERSGLGFFMDDEGSVGA